MQFELPDLGEGIHEAELVQWLVQPGESVSHGQTLMEVMTDKAVVSVASPFAGTVRRLLAESGSQLKVGRPVLEYELAKSPAVTAVADAADAGATSAPSTSQRETDGPRQVASSASVPQRDREPSSGPVADEGSEHRARAAPSVRRKARELGVDLAAVQGTGPGGRVLMRDLESTAVTGRGNGHEARKIPASNALSFTPGSRLKVRGLRRAIADAMVHSKRTIPHYSLMDECDVTELVRLRASLKESCEKASVKLTYLAFVVKAAVAALKEVPLINASLDESAEEIVLHDRYHIGVATATPHGLIVPVIHDADQKNILEIAREIERLSSAARSARADLQDLRGATFTITSIGNIGGLISTPIIHAPEAAIMGVGKIVRRPVYDDQGQLRPADLMYLSFSFDHRVIDGDVGARFAQALIARLQRPAELLLPSLT